MNGTKNALFFLSQAPTHHSFPFNLRFFLELYMGYAIFDSVLFLLKFLYFCSTKCMEYLTLNRHNSFQNKNNRKATHSFFYQTSDF